MLEPLQTLFDTAPATPSLLTAELERLHGGPLSFPAAPAGRPHTIANFVTGVDGVVSYGMSAHRLRSGDGGESGPARGGPAAPDTPPRPPIFGDAHDRLIMAILRLVCDAVLIGSRTLAAGLPGGTLLWSAILPRAHREELRPLFAAAEARLERQRRRRHVIVTATGDIDLRHELFGQPDVEAVVATTKSGSRTLERAPGRAAADIRVLELPGTDAGVDLEQLLALLRREGTRLLLSEGGPRLHGNLEARGLVDEIFLTTSPWVPGRDETRPRPTFSGVAHPAGTTPRTALVALKRHGDYLFSRRRYVR